MRSGLVMVLKIPRQDAAQVMLVEDDDVIQAFAADRADEALDIGSLPGARGAVTTSLMPITRTRSRKAGPYDASGPAADSGARYPRERPRSFDAIARLVWDFG